MPFSQEGLPRLFEPEHDEDPALDDVFAAFLTADPDGTRAARVLRATFDQLYDGQRTGRYRWDDLFKTEKTHFGTLIEINFRREFDDIIDDGELLDYRVRGHDIDCKYSFRSGGWMLPPECFGQLLLVCTASDENSEWSLGIVRAAPERLREGKNRDLKTGLNLLGREAIRWLRWAGELPPNVLLHIDKHTQEAIFASRYGQQRVNELFRRVTNTRIGRNTVATVAQQDDYMKRVRYNGGARSALADEGYLILGGDFSAHRDVARELLAEVPGSGEFVSVRVVPCDDDEQVATILDGRKWTLADADEACRERAPMLPKVSLGS